MMGHWDEVEKRGQLRGVCEVGDRGVALEYLEGKRRVNVNKYSKIVLATIKNK